MATLIVLGNINRFTFANSILAANHKSLEIFGDKLSSIYIFHSKDSIKQLTTQTDWINYLESHEIEQDLFIHKVVDIYPKHESISRFINAIERIIKGISDDSNLMIDLSNGTSLQKN